MTLHAEVRNGRLEPSEPMELTEGQRFELVPVDELDEDDGMDDAERARLHAALDTSRAEIAAGRGIPVEDVLAVLRARSASAP